MTVYVVTGPPAAGKSTWVRENAKPGDITIDYDTLVQVLSPGQPSDPVEQSPYVVMAAQAARDAAFNESADAAMTDVYLVHAMPDRHALNRYRKFGYEIVTVDPGYDECMRRAAAQRTPRQVAIVDDWYRRRGLV